MTAADAMHAGSLSEHSETKRGLSAPTVIVVGSGIAGLTAALHAIKSGCSVTLVTKDVLENANTRFAQGGIAGVMFADDRTADHLHDTLVAGAGLGDEDAVRVLVEEGPRLIGELADLGVAFDRADDGTWVKGLEAAHSYPRVLHAGGDATGAAIETTLVDTLRMSAARVIEHAFLVDLVVDTRVRGVDLLLGGGGEGLPSRRETILADAVVLATGGAGELFAHTTNPSVATADGIAAALRAGAAVTDLEFVQFHPTVLATGTAFLVSEAVRGEGATLIDENGRRFTFDAHPDGELAPRDVVARAITAQMQRQDGRPVFLDATGLRATPQATADFLARRFPTIDRAVRERGVDWAREPIPVTPAAHYLMGGVTTDLQGRTSLPGLYAVGEVARTGVHGANRLASNSLLEGAVFGARAGDAIAADAASAQWPVLPTTSATIADVAGSSAAPPFTRRALQELLWADAGLVRDAGGLGHAASVLAGWRMQAGAPSTVTEAEDANLLLVATHVVTAALARPVSIGAHFRSDSAAVTSARTPHERVTARVSQARHAAFHPTLRSSAREAVA